MPSYSTSAALKYRDSSPRCCERAKLLLSVRGRTRKRTSPDDWWADVLADPRARRQTRGNHSRGALNIYRQQDEPRATVLVACTKSLGRRHHQVRKLRQEVGKKKGEGRRQDDSKR